jgi:hypothetical protein
MFFAFQVAIYILWVTEKLKIRSVSSWLESDKIFNILLTMEDSFVLLSGCSFHPHGARKLHFNKYV